MCVCVCVCVHVCHECVRLDEISQMRYDTCVCVCVSVCEREYLASRAEEESSLAEPRALPPPPLSPRALVEDDDNDKDEVSSFPDPSAAQKHVCQFYCCVVLE